MTELHLNEIITLLKLTNRARVSRLRTDLSSQSACGDKSDLPIVKQHLDASKSAPNLAHSVKMRSTLIDLQRSRVLKLQNQQQIQSLRSPTLSPYKVHEPALKLHSSTLQVTQH